MDDGSPAWRVHAGLCWFSAGLVACGSFLLAPVKLAAQLSTLPQLLEVGRLQFLALHTAQWLLLPTLAAWAYLGRASGWRLAGSVGALALFVVQMAALQPELDRRLAMQILGESPGPSAHHTVYGILEALKIACLVAAGVSRRSKG
ncbi:MAG: hypothetical protein LDL56_11865 [Armatimonadetes bacterium]|nr:hypothetical protein [Armatimonadota bacterium]MCA1997909.1 hypothetical protein [Armatimonadota bacterium]